MTTANEWNDICGIDDLVDNSGVCALLGEKQIAIFTQNRDQQTIFATDNYDPIGKANVLYRGILGSVADKNVVASPLYKQRFCLHTGQCLDDPEQQINTYPVKVVDQRVLIQMALAE